MHREQRSTEVGNASIEPRAPVEAGAGGTWRIGYTAGPRGVDVGGRVRITIPHGFTSPQTSAFFDPGFTTVETDAPGVDLSLEVNPRIFCRLDPETGHSGAWGRSVFVQVGGRALREGESFTLVYGNADYYRAEPAGLAGAYARELSGPAEFTVAVDPEGNRSGPYSGYLRLTEQPTLQVLPGRPVRLRAIVPSDIRAGKTCRVTAVSIDRFNNPVRLEAVRQGASAPCAKEDPACCRPVVASREARLEAAANPQRVRQTEPETKVFWGDIHGHTQHSDGLGTPDDYYTFAREVGALDFSAITDHDDIGPRLSDEEWEVITDAAERWNDPGRFVTLLGFEYRNGLCDMCVYYPGPEGPLLRGTDGDLGDATELTRRVKEAGGMIVPHFHFGADWSGFDPDVYRVLEVYSQHGSAEYPGCPREIPYLRRQLQKSSATNKDCYAHDALRQAPLDLTGHLRLAAPSPAAGSTRRDSRTRRSLLGYRLGFTAGSDTHSARPGFSDWTRVCRTYLGGLTAIVASELTREAVWQALHERRCYATTGNRSLLEFAVNGSPMGSEVAVESGARRVISVVCHADGELEAVTVYRQGECWKHERTSGESVDLVLHDHHRTTSDWYYVRLDLAGGEMVWGSPVWVDVEAE